LDNSPTPHAVAAARANCGNCGSALTGPFCAQCGQHAHESARSVAALFHDAWHLATHVDDRLWKTLYTLLLHPGVLTKEYFADTARAICRRYGFIWCSACCSLPLVPAVRTTWPGTSKAAVFLILLVETLFASIAGLFGWTAVGRWVVALTSIYAIWYVYRAMRVYYEQGRSLTLFKLGVAGFTYLIGFSLTLLMTLIVSIIFS
jgi:hypothetical protein